MHSTPATVDAIAAKPPAATTEPPDRPLALVSIAAARQRLGGISTTTFYKWARVCRLLIIPFGGRSFVRSDDLDEFIALLTDNAVATKNPHQARARQLAPKAVAARRARHDPKNE